MVVLESFKDKTLLVIAPHPDDEVLGCGGLIGRVKADGGKVYVMIITVGDHPQYGAKSVANIRISEAKNVMELLKVDDYEICWSGNERHLKLDSFPQKELIDLIENGSKVALNKVEPDIVAVSHPNANQDHRAVFEATFTACRPRPVVNKPLQSVVISYEDASHGWSMKSFTPNMYLDIKDFIKVKCDALTLYNSQLHPNPHYISIDAVRSLAHLRGIEVGREFAEAFQIHRFFV